ncbi:MAG TPA: hypothetical protein VH437_10365 [Terriglobales bacterium]
MNRFTRVVCVSAMLLSFGASSLLAQTAQRPPSSSPAPIAKPAQQQPCWQQAGLTQDVQQQREQIEQNSKAEVQSVCNDSSLNAQQRQVKIRQVHRQAQQQSQALITPEQQQALASCHAQRSAGGTIHAPGASQDPCANFVANPSTRKP